MSEHMKISTNQVRSTGDIVGIAIVERLDQIIALLEPLAFPVRELVIDDPAVPS